jgi:hypothetical protein
MDSITEHAKSILQIPVEAFAVKENERVRLHCICSIKAATVTTPLQSAKMVLSVSILSAEGLAAKDASGSSDPYCTLELVRVSLPVHIADAPRPEIAAAPPRIVLPQARGGRKDRGVLPSNVPWNEWMVLCMVCMVCSDGVHGMHGAHMERIWSAWSGWSGCSCSLCQR